MGAAAGDAWGLQAVRRPQANMHTRVTFKASVVIVGAPSNHLRHTFKGECVRSCNRRGEIQKFCCSRRGAERRFP